jgi:hypothetical protein
MVENHLHVIYYGQNLRCNVQDLTGLAELDPLLKTPPLGRNNDKVVLRSIEILRSAQNDNRDVVTLNKAKGLRRFLCAYQIIIEKFLGKLTLKFGDRHDVKYKKYRFYRRRQYG